MVKMFSREDYRKIKSMSKQEMERWLGYERQMTYNELRREFEKNYQDEIASSVSNFLVAIWYTVHFTENIQLSHDELASFMDDLYVTVDMFRKGEYKPDDYKKQLEEDGIKFSEFDYDKLYRDVKESYKKYVDRNAKAKAKLKELIGTSEDLGDLQNILDILEGKDVEEGKNVAKKASDK